jgi:hypothetical protein
MSKINNNSGCPCGSGKKYKKCCKDFSPRKKIYGYSQVIDAISDPLDRHLVCMIQKINGFLLRKIQEAGKNNFKLGHYVITSGSCHKEDLQIHPCQKTIQSAMEYAVKNLGAKHFMEMS